MSQQYSVDAPLTAPDGPDTSAVLAGGGETGALMRCIDWSGTAVGPVAGWPQPLRFVVRLILGSPHPMFVFWGPALVCFYNDAFSASLGPEQHPGALGRPARQVWGDIWGIIGPQIALVMAGKSAPWHENELVPITRYGRQEDAYWTYSYSPIEHDGAENGIGGLLVICNETTSQVAAVRRQVTDAATGAAERDRWGALFAQAPSFMAMLAGPDHRIELANEAFLRVVGHRDVVGRTVAEALPDAAAQGYVALLDKVYASGEAYRTEGARYAMQVTPGGPVSDRFVDFIFQPIRDAAGAVTGIFIDGSDTTERTSEELALRAGDAALRRSEEEFRTLGELQPHLCWMAKADGWIYWYNRRWYEYMGLSPEQLEGWGWQSVQHPDYLPAVMERWTAALASGEPFDMTFPLRGADGTYRTFLTRSVPVRDNSGAITRWFGSNVDITEQQAVAAALQESEARFRVLADSMPQMVWATTPDGRNDYFNARWFEFTGITDGSTSGDGWATVLHPDDQAMAWDTWQRSVASGEPFEIEYRLRRHDGVYRWVLGRALPQHGADGAIIRWFGTCTDIDDTKQAAEVLRRSRTELTRLVEDRTAALLREMEERRKAEAALRQGEKLQAIGQLTGGIAHDFNNILQVVTSGATLLARPTMTDDRRAMVLDGMTNAANSARELTGRLLAFARKQSLKPEAFDLNARLSGMSELLRHTLGSLVTIETRLDPGLWLAMADVSQMEVAVLNLAMNARDAMAPKGGRLVFETRNALLDATLERAAGEYVCVAVRDSGAGMTPAVLARVFEPFFTTKGLGQGTGLGLAQVHGFCKQSGGDIAVDSVPGQGTTMTIHLPRADASAIAAPPAVKPERPALEHEMKRAAGLTVLIVEDNPDVAGFAATMLEGLGYETRLAGHAADALALIGTGVRIDAMFTDVVMPGDMNGMQLADHVQRHHPGIAVVLASGYSETATEWLGSATAELLSKPYRIDDLAAALGRALERLPAAE